MTIDCRRVLLVVLTLAVLTGCVTAPILGPSAQSEYEAGLALFKEGNYTAAIERLKTAIELDPELTEAYLYLGRAYFNQGEFLEAVSYFRNAYYNLPENRRGEVVSSFLESLIKGGLERFKKGDYTNAIALLKEAVGLDSSSVLARGELVDVLVDYGKTLLSEGRFNDALEVFSESLDFAPNNWESYVGMAKAFFNQGELSDALRAIKKALKAAPNNDEVKALFSEILSGG